MKMVLPGAMSSWTGIAGTAQGPLWQRLSSLSLGTPAWNLAPVSRGVAPPSSPLRVGPWWTVRVLALAGRSGKEAAPAFQQRSFGTVDRDTDGRLAFSAGPPIASSSPPSRGKPAEESDRDSSGRRQPGGGERRQSSRYASTSEPWKAAPPPARRSGPPPPPPQKTRRTSTRRAAATAEPLRTALQAAGVASRRKSEELITGGHVTVNGNVCIVPQTPVQPLKDSIYVDGRSLPRRAPPRLYFALHKPKGYICTAAADASRPVVELFDDFLLAYTSRNPGLPPPRLFTVGRLDVATTGLLLVTNDGAFSERVTHPSSGVTKEYVAAVDQRVTRRQLAAISEGAIVQGVKVTPKLVELLPGEPGMDRTRIRIVVGEGRHHEVRIMVENSGLTVDALKRTRIGGFRMPRSLAAGRFLELTPNHLKKIMDVGAQDTV